MSVLDCGKRQAVGRRGADLDRGPDGPKLVRERVPESGLAEPMAAEALAPDQRKPPHHYLVRMVDQ